MQKQSGKSVALYYRTATRQTPGQHLDNQMQNLLCHSEGREFPFSFWKGGGSA
jgi:hypothetical protein